MKTTRLKKTELTLPQLSLGTMTFGGQTLEGQANEIMDIALEGGMTLFDTANIYNVGESETIVGKWLHSKRDQIILATKVGYGMGQGLTQVSLSPEAMREGLKASLDRLQTDYVDLYYLHAPDMATPIEKSLETTADFINSGKVCHYGVSNYAAWQISDILRICEREGFPEPVITQNVYNLLSRSIEDELVPFLASHPMGLTVYNPFAAGLLTGKHLNKKAATGTRLADNPTYRKRYWTEANLKTVDKLAQVADQVGLSLLELSMKWCLENPMVSSLLVGVSKPSQLEQNIEAIKGGSLDKETLQACDDIWGVHTGNPFRYNR